VEVEISKDSSSFMAWIRIPNESTVMADFLRFMNRIGGPAAVRTSQERGLLKEMKGIVHFNSAKECREARLREWRGGSGNPFASN